MTGLDPASLRFQGVCDENSRWGTLSLYALSVHVWTDRQQPGWTRSLTCVDQDPPRLPGPHGPAWAGGTMGRAVGGRGGCRVSGFSLEPFFPLGRRRWPRCRSAPGSRPAPSGSPGHGGRMLDFPGRNSRLRGAGSLAAGHGLPGDGAGIRGDCSSLVAAGI